MCCVLRGQLDVLAICVRLECSRLFEAVSYVFYRTCFFFESAWPSNKAAADAPSIVIILPVNSVFVGRAMKATSSAICSGGTGRRVGI